MIAAATPRRAGLLLNAGIAVLLALALWPWLRWALHAPTPPNEVLAAAQATVPALPPLDQFRETAERPLFLPERRPAAAAPKIVATFGMRLEGIVAIGAERRAIVKQSDGRTARVGPGDRIGEWTVQRIDADRVVLGAGDRRLELTPQRAAPAR
jgi:general secretion pathway protein N